jgi:hypothetical protein
MSAETGTPARYTYLADSTRATFDAPCFLHLQAVPQKSEVVFTKSVYGIFILKEE